jgi:predicted nuclease of predicted toxin-antitoxin system
VPTALSDAGFPVVAHDQLFAQNTPDEEWLAVVGKQGLIVLSADKAIRRKSNELEALRRNKVRAVFLTSGNLTAAQQADLLVRYGRKIQDHAMSAAAPAVFSLSKNGKLTKLKV